MILVDANLLIYAIDSDAPHHSAARHWLENTLSGTVPVALSWVVILAVIRITTRPGIMRKPLAPEAVLAYVESWLQQPSVNPINPGDNHWSILHHLLASCGTAGNLTTDAHIAALALEYGCTVYSTDNDFKRFPGLKHVNPLTDRV